MSETIYRKYRPKTFRDVIGQEHIITTLTNAVATNKIAHAYLFTGPRGTGKTTTARLFAAAINCQKRRGFSPAPKQTCSDFENGTALDLIEIDAASHTGVDHIRDLRETIALAPTAAPYKVYIIDEVHMLSLGAFNALLKTLEEPPAHVVFILATTEIHKVPETVISRTQRFDFARISTSHIIKKLQKIISAENVEADADALELIALSARGGMRDAESILAHVLSFVDQKITSDAVINVLGLAPNESCHDLSAAFIHADIHKALAIISEVVRNDFNLHVYMSALIEYLRTILFYTLTPTAEMEQDILLSTTQKKHAKRLAKETDTVALIKMIEHCIHAQQTITDELLPQLPLEIAAVKICTSSHTQHLADTHHTDENQTPHKKTPSAASKKSQKKTAHKKSAIVSREEINKKWQKVIAFVGQKNMPLASLLMQAIVKDVHDDVIVIIVKYNLHKDKICQKKSQLTIRQAFDTILSIPLEMRVEVVSERDFLRCSPSQLLSDARNLMGGTFLEKIESM